MKKIITILLFLSPFVNRAQQTYEWEGASFAQAALISGNAYSQVVITSNDDKILLGNFEGTTSYKNSTVSSTELIGVFLAKQDVNDSLIWMKKIIEGTSLYNGTSLTLDNLDNIYISFAFKDTVYVDNIPYINNNINPSYSNTPTLKFDSNGNLLEIFSLEGSCYSGASIHIDNNQNRYLFGGYGNDTWGTTDSCTCSFDSTTIYTTEEAEVFLAKYDASGNLLWVNTFGNNKYISVSGFRIIDDAIYISGGSFYASDVDFGPFTLSYPNNYDNGAFMAKYDTSGVFKWARYYGVTGWDSHVVPSDMEVLNSNTIVVGGQVQTQSEAAHLYIQNSSSLYGLQASASQTNYFVLTYDSLGNIKWKDFAECRERDYLSAMSKDSKGNLLVTGSYSHELYFGNDTLPNAFEDLWVGAYDSVGTKLWAKRAGGPGFSSGIDIEVDSDDNIYINGNTTSNPTIIGNSSYIISEPSIFLAKMVPSLISNTTAIPLANANKQLIKIVDVLGRETKAVKGRLLFYIYSDGTVEKQIFLN